MKFCLTKYFIAHVSRLRLIQSVWTQKEYIDWFLFYPLIVAAAAVVVDVQRDCLWKRRSRFKSGRFWYYYLDGSLDPNKAISLYDKKSDYEIFNLLREWISL